jgi:hypothetical protein
MPGSSPGMTISLEFKNLRHGRARPGHPRPTGILLIGCHSAFFRILLVLRSIQMIDPGRWIILKSKDPRRTGEGRCPWQKWIPAVAGRQENGNSSEPSECI